MVRPFVLRARVAADALLAGSYPTLLLLKDGKSHTVRLVTACAHVLTGVSAQFDRQRTLADFENFAKSYYTHSTTKTAAIVSQPVVCTLPCSDMGARASPRLRWRTGSVRLRRPRPRLRPQPPCMRSWSSLMVLLLLLVLLVCC